MVTPFHGARPAAAAIANFEGKLQIRKEIVLSGSSDAPGMKGERSRTKRGQLRRKRDDTHVGTIEKEYGLDFGVRKDMELGTLLKREDKSSLNDLLHDD